MRETDGFSDEESSEIDMMEDTPITYDELPVGAEPDRLLPPTTALADSAEWQRTIESVVRNVVSIRFSRCAIGDANVRSMSARS